MEHRIYAGLFLRVEKDPREILEETFGDLDALIGEWTEDAGWVVLPNKDYHEEGYYIDNFYVSGYYQFPPRTRYIHRDWITAMRAFDQAFVKYVRDQGILVLLD